MSEQDNELDAGGEELNESLGADEMGLVGETKPPLNRGAVLMFGLMLAGVAGTYLMYVRSGPQSADAAVIAQTEAVDETINSFLRAKESNRKLMEQMLQNTQKVVQQFLSYPSATQVPLSDLHTNPFRHAPLKPATVDDSAEAARKKREEERVALLKAVQQLQLQSIMHSDTMRACMIDNTLYQESQPVGSFLIEKINPNSVIIKSGAYRFELRMQR